MGEPTPAESFVGATSNTETGPDHETRRLLEAVAMEDHRVAIIPTGSVGVSEARNLAVELATSDFIAFANDDCVVVPGVRRFGAGLLERKRIKPMSVLTR